ncbi:MAG: molybdenum-pterin binding domain protein [Acidobacteriaceae bacterium]|nr:molybdenum-pterin binding domain protein [Acidobacteriaceae bacterium]
MAPRTQSLLTPREAAGMLNISYPTIKQWILSGKISTLPTPGGHHRIAASTLKPFLKREEEAAPVRSRERYRKVSGRNQLVGKVIEIKIDGLMAKVVVAIGDQRITSIITSDAVREMQLKRGDTAAALVKSTDVMIELV